MLSEIFSEIVDRPTDKQTDRQTNLYYPLVADKNLGDDCLWFSYYVFFQFKSGDLFSAWKEKITYIFFV